MSFSPTGVRCQVEQGPPALSLQEGDNGTLWCNCSSAMNNVQWFRQDPGGRLINLFYIPSGTKHNGRLKATAVPLERRSSLYITSSQTTDSATYFCAVEPQCSLGTCNLYTNAQLGSATAPTTVASEARMQHLLSLVFLTHINRLLTTL